MKKIFTLFFIVAFGFQGLAQTLMPLPPHSTVFSGSVRGYWFVAPVDFTITGLMVAPEAGTGLQYIHVMKCHDPFPIAFGAQSSNFTTLAYISGAPNGVVQTVNIPVTAGDTIGILGQAGTSNSYTAGTTHTSTIAGNTVSLSRLGYQGNITTGAAPSYWGVDPATAGELSRVEMYYSTGPCTNPPVTGTVTSNVANACIGSNFTLSLSGGSTGSGQTYQWESSNDNINFTPIAGATNPTLTTSQTVSTWYRAVVTCGVSVTSTSLQIISPPAVSGNFTIDGTVPTGGSNFQTFADAINYVKCGINGPVVFNVAPGSGPYTQQVIIPAIGGASATNTVTFNGNGAIIDFNSTNTNQRAGITLDGADHVTIKNFVITGTGTTTTDYNFGIHLLNGADSNVIKNCTINITAASTSTNFAGIAISGSFASATTAGSNSDYNVIDSNIINGGYYGITLLGATGTPATGNRITNNTVQDWYLYGIYISNTLNTLIEKNDINRLTRSASITTFNGIYFTGLSETSHVSKNKIHDPFAGSLTSTSAAYGIYHTGVDATAGDENLVSNNLIYNFIGGGTQYALYNSSSDSVKYYHNTVVLDDAGYTGTAATRGFYQVTAANGIELKNNIIVISRGGAGAKHALYFGTTTSTIVSNNNVLYNTSTSGINAIGFYNTDFTTLTDWQAANSSAYDQASVSTDPMFVNPGSGDYQPSSPQINNIGGNVGIATDILDSARLIPSPDPGAYEFSLGNCINPPTAGTAISSLTNVCQGVSFSLTLNGNSVGNAQMYQWQSSPDNLNWTNIGASSTASVYTTSQSASTYYRAQVTCGAGTPVFSTSVLVTSPALVSGNFTINGGVPTGGTNFQTFADAINYVRCGINGPVVFNVAAGSGPYTEQVIIPVIGGASATNTVTFNGNGAAIDFNSLNTNQRAGITLDGADHVTIKNFIITGTGTTTTDYNFGIHLVNGADSNVIKNCTINITTASTSTNFAGIAISGSFASATTAGSNSDYNVIDSNIINGGYYGITLLGVAGAPATGNRITNNTVQDWYLYGIYISNTLNTLIEKNDINRLTRSASITTFNGIYFTGLSEATHVSKNRIHDPFAGSLTSTSAAYGIYHTGVDATAGNENLVSNNLIYNFIGGGTQYALYNSSSDSVRYYHNTVVLDDAGYTGTAATRGFYQVTAANGIELKNNIIVISRGGAGAKHALYFGTTTSTIVSNNNVLYNTSASGINAIGFFNTDFTTLTDWQAANSNAYDQASVSIDPVFTNPAAGDYTPTSSLVDNTGVPAGITTDIRDSARSTVSPDAGAYEFSTLTAGVNMSAQQLVTPASQATGCYTSAETVTIRIRNTSTSTINFAANPVTVTTQVSGAVTQTLTAVVNTGTLASDSTLDVVMTQTLNMSVSGVYTFNASTTVAGDVNPANDAMLPVNRTKQALSAGTAAASPSTYCVPAPFNPALSSTGYSGQTGFQWLSSTASAGVYTPVSGATSIPYTVPVPLTQAMYYKLVVQCGTTTDTSGVVTVSFSNPMITDTTSAERCGAGDVTLAATASGSATVTWYAAATGGSPLATGNSFTTNITANTTFYVSANDGGTSSGASPILVTEMDLGTTTDQLEIQNVSSNPVDVTGWRVAISNAYGDINAVNANIQVLSGVMAPGETKSWTDQAAATNYWGSNILWNPGAFPGFAGWAAILDNNNNLVDIVFFNWLAANIQGANIMIGTTPIVASSKWTGDGINTSVAPDGQSVSRQGNLDNDNLSDFAIIPFTIGTTNPGLTIPFAGFGCESARIAVAASIDGCTVPVTLLSFSGEKQGVRNILTWTTATEVNNAGFELQRSVDGSNFSRLSFIASQAAEGNSNRILSYRFDDEKPFAGNSYYRLKQMDKDGRYKYSSVVMIKGAKVNVVSISSIYPNPVKTNLNMVITSPTAEKVNMQVTDISGRLVMQQAAQLISGDNQLNLSLVNISAGTYIIKAVCANGCESAMKKFVKE